MYKMSVHAALPKKARVSGRNRLFVWLMLAPSIVLVLVFTYYPVIRGMPMAFQSYSLWDIANTKWIGLQNFIALFSQPIFLKTIPNTVLWVFASLFFQLLIGFSLALLLKEKFKGRGLYQGSIFFPWAVSGFLIGILWRWIYNGSYGVLNDLLIKIGLIDNLNPIGFLSNSDIALWSCILTNVWYGIAFFAIMIQAALQGVPADLYEAAEVDGASKLTQLVHITIPSIKPVLMLTILLRMVWIFNFPELIYALTRGGPGGSSEIMTSYLLNMVMFGTDYGQASAMGIILMLVMMAYTGLYYLVTRTKKEDEE